jgi:hypothetical protein
MTRHQDGAGAFSRTVTVMSKKPPEVVEYAVRTCLEKCVQTDMPMTCLSDYITELKESGWDETSIHTFQFSVLKGLAKSKEDS